MAVIPFRHALAKHSAPRPPGLQLGGYRIYSVDELTARRAGRAIIQDFLPRDALVVLYGPPSAGKTFVALHLALSAAVGQRCFGKPVHRCEVLYVAAEGGGGLGHRLQVWVQRHPKATPRLDHLHFLTEPVNLLSSDAVEDFIEALRSLRVKPRLLVIDTLARCMVGGDENASKDMGIAVAALDQIRKATGCSILILHHTTKTGLTERGSGALRGAADTMISLRKRKTGGYVLRCTKQKEDSPFPRLLFDLEEVELLTDELEASCVVAFAEPLSDRLKSILTFARSRETSGGITRREVTTTLRLPDRSSRRLLKDLVQRGYLCLVEGDIHGPKGPHYTLTTAGAEASK